MSQMSENRTSKKSFERDFIAFSSYYFETAKNDIFKENTDNFHYLKPKKMHSIVKKKKYIFICDMGEMQHIWTGYQTYENTSTLLVRFLELFLFLRLFLQQLLLRLV